MRLRGLASAAASNADDPVFRPGEARYVRTRERQATYSQGADGGSGPAVVASVPELREVWFGIDTRGRLLVRSTGAPEILSGKASDIPPEVSQHAADGVDLGTGITFSLGGRPLPLRKAADMPDDPQALLALIRKRSEGQGPSPDAEAFTVVGDALRETPLPRRLRVALLKTVALIPGVRVSSGTDAAGRAAVIATRDSPAGSEELLLDPDDGTLLEERTVSLGADGIPAGKLISRATLEAAAVVDAVGARS